MRAKHKPQKLPNVTFGIHKKQINVSEPGLATSQETLLIYSQVRSSGIAPKSSRNLALENGSESLEQQQDSCPRHAKHRPIKLSKRRLRNPLKGKKKDSLQAFRHRKKHFYTIARCARLEALRKHLEIWPWKTVPKASNSSRIRAQGMQNTSQ